MRSKGFMHAMEGVIAALLLLTYGMTIIQYPQVYSTWTEIKQKQVSREYLSSFNDAGLSWLIVENRPSEFVEISRYFLGVRNSYGLYTEGLVSQNIVIGVFSNESVKNGTVSATCASTGVPSEFGCYNGTFKGHKFVLTDNDTGVGNGQEDYDSIYFDSDNNGTYDEYEGPRTLSSTINVSGEIWIFSSIDNDTQVVEFIRGEDIVEYRRKINSLKINNRETNISIRARTNESDIMDLDILIIPRYMDLTNIKPNLDKFLDAGKSIIEVANITCDNLDEIQRDIFGLQCLNLDTMPFGDENISIISRKPTESAYEIEKLFYFTNIKIDTQNRFQFMNHTWTVPGYEYDCYLGSTNYYVGHVNCTNLTSTDPCTTHTIDGIINYVNSSESVYCRIGTKYTKNTYFYGEVNIRGEKHFILIVNATGSGYDRIYIDINRDHNLTNDYGQIIADDIIKIGHTNFTVKKIDERGRYFEIRPVSEHKFLSAHHDKLYSIHNDTEYIVLAEDTEYNVTAYDIDDMVQASTSAGVGTCTNGLFAGSGYKHNNSWAMWFPFTITNVSQSFNMLNVDFNSNGACNEPGEGPFYTGDIVRVGPEYYRVDIAEDGSKVNWTLTERWKIPSAIVNHKDGLRKTAWIRSNMTSDDEYHILRSTILWSSSHKSELVRSSKTSESVVVKSTFIEDMDMFQPYRAYFRVGG
ncbi:MAG: hypothetical protein DRN71_00900 [Candidatus Nanohalarchaeota archaeon]|nr:MAG: hypothetical protein DRN71_00900 [Candidatus Nanohaloarchaeota archaeon]